MNQSGSRPAYREYAGKTPIILLLLPIYQLTEKS